MSETPEELYYAPTHEWVRLDETAGVATVGISDFAQGELGDVVFVELPELGRQVRAREEISVVESVKTASDLYAPLSGEVVAVNQALDATPEVINSSPYGDGWIFQIKYSDEAEVKELLSAAEYQESCLK